MGIRGNDTHGPVQTPLYLHRHPPLAREDNAVNGRFEGDTNDAYGHRGGKGRSVVRSYEPVCLGGMRGDDGFHSRGHGMDEYTPSVTSSLEGSLNG